MIYIYIILIIICNCVSWILLLYFSISASNDLSLDSKFRVSVFSDGRIMWIPSVTWNTTCDMNLLFFPFDVQKCSVMMSSWIYSASLLDFVALSQNVSLSGFQESSDWILVSTNVSIQHIDFQDSSLPVIIFTVNIHLFYYKIILY